MKSNGQETNKWVDFLDIGPNSSPAEILLNERIKQMPDEDRIKEIIQLMKDFFAKPVFLDVNKQAEECLFWLLKMLKRSFEIKPYNPSCDNREDFNLCLRRLYQASIEEDYSSALKFSKVKREIWKEIMADWHPELYAELWDQEIFSFFLSCGLLASGEEKEIMSDVLRQRLEKSKARDIEAWAKWMQERLPKFANVEIGRRFAIARASDGGWDLLLQNICDSELAESLSLRDFNPDLLPALRSARDRIVAIDYGAKSLVDKIKIFLALDLSSGESISHKINSPEFVVINIFCASSLGSRGNTHLEIAESIYEFVREGCYMQLFDGGGSLLAYSVNLLIRVHNLQGALIHEKRFSR